MIASNGIITQVCLFFIVLIGKKTSSSFGIENVISEFSSFKNANTDAFPTQAGNTGSATSPGTPSSVQSMFGDATLTIMSAKNNPVVEVRFQDVYPVSIGALAFDQQEGDITYLTSTATFQYKLYEIFTL